MSVVERVVGALDTKRGELLDIFESHTEKHFTWLSELQEELAKQGDEELTQSASIMLPKTPSRNKRRPKRKATTRSVTKAKAPKVKRAPMQDITQQPATRTLRKRTVSICTDMPVTETSGGSVEGTSNAVKRNTRVTRSSLRITRSSQILSTPEPLIGDEAQSVQPCPETVVKAGSPHCPDTVVRSSGSTSTPVCPDTVVRASTPESTVQTAEQQNTPATVVKPKAITPTDAATVHTPETVIKSDNSSDANIVDVQKTPAARFAAALALAAEATTPQTIKTKTHHKPSLVNSNKATDRNSGVHDMIQEIEKKVDAQSSGEDTNRHATRKGPRVKSKMNMVESAVSASADQNTKSATTRKRKSDILGDENQVRDPESERVAFINTKKAVLAVTRQQKKRKPTRHASKKRKIAASDTADPIEQRVDNPNPLTQAQILHAKAEEKAAALRADRERRLQAIREKQVSKAATSDLLKKQSSSKGLKVPGVSSASESIKKRDALEKARQIKLQAAIQKKEAMQKERLERERQRKAAEDLERKQRNEQKRLEMERNRQNAERRRAKEAEAQARRAKIRQEEQLLQAKMMARKRELEEAKQEFNNKLAKAKAQREAEFERREKERRIKEREAQEARDAKRREHEAEVARLRAATEKQDMILKQRQAEEAKRRDEEIAKLSQVTSPAAVSSIDNIASPVESPFESYDLSGLRSDASSDDEDDPREAIPSWAQGAALKNAIYNQFIFTPPERKVMQIFPSPDAPNLGEIFPKKKSKFRPRTSSAYWEPSPGRTNIRKRF